MIPFDQHFEIDARLINNSHLHVSVVVIAENRVQ